jgi:hypothetical protein
MPTAVARAASRRIPSTKEKVALTLITVCLLFALASMALVAMTFTRDERECLLYLRTEDSFCVVPDAITSEPAALHEVLAVLREVRLVWFREGGT